MNERYYTFAAYLKKQGYAGRVQKLSLHAGFTCPNRDGSISRDGCIFCDNTSFVPPLRNNTPLSVPEQITTGMEALKKRYGAEHFIAYFQSFTNTYASFETLKKTYDTVLEFPEVIGLSVGTRPDCIDEEKLGLIELYTGRLSEVWIEYGLQSIHDTTLNAINRGHDAAAFIEAVKKTRRYAPHVKIGVHVILGLPGEDEAMMVKTAQKLGELKIDGVKLHPLYVVKGTELEQQYNAGTLKLLSLQEYAHAAVRFMEELWPQTVVQRVGADCPAHVLVAPAWISDKKGLQDAIAEMFNEENSFQGEQWQDQG